MHEARAKAWATRRALHGPQGHAGAYSRSRREDRALALIARLHREGTLSEGQCCAGLGMDRVAFRVLCDRLGNAASPTRAPDAELGPGTNPESDSTLPTPQGIMAGGRR